MRTLFSLYLKYEYWNVWIQATNVVLPNGSFDPWHKLGFYTPDEENGVVPVYIDGMSSLISRVIFDLCPLLDWSLISAGTAHCADMYEAYPGEPAGLEAARKIIKDNVAKWLAWTDCCAVIM